MHPDLLLVLLYLAFQCAFVHCGSLSHFMLAWIDLFDAPWYMDIAMRKGAQYYASMIFSTAHKSVQHIRWVRHINQRGAQVDLGGKKVQPRL